MDKKVCVITGGANGIGRCIAEKFIRAGYAAAVVDTDAPSGEILAAEYGAESFMFFPGDVSDRETLERFAAAVLKRFSRVDALVNNACVMRGGLKSDSYDEFMYLLRTGLAAPFYLTKLFSPAFSKGASVINISSTRAHMSQVDTESYTAAKGGLSSLTRALSVTLAGRVRVNSVSPGWIDTSAYHRGSPAPQHSREDILQHPAGRIGAPEDIAAAVLFLASDSAGFITGQDLVIDGGMSRLMIYHGDGGWSFSPET